MTTRAHNAITYDGGQGQAVGRMDAAGQVVRFLHSPNYDFVVGDATSAYGGTVRKALRSLVFIRPGLVVVHDQLTSTIPHIWEWNMHALSEMEATGYGSFIVNDGDESLCVNLAAPTRIAFRQKKGFAVAPDLKDAAPQYHGAFATAKPLAKSEFVAVLQVNCQNGSPTIVRDGATWRVQVTGHTIELTGGSDPVVR